MVRELHNPTEEEMQDYLVGNLCRCTGYMGHLRALRSYMAYKQGVKA
jgi:carbon-monoxide dehydrogenase small subunit